MGWSRAGGHLDGLGGTCHQVAAGACHRLPSPQLAGAESCFITWGWRQVGLGAAPFLLLGQRGWGVPGAAAVPTRAAWLWHCAVGSRAHQPDGASLQRGVQHGQGASSIFFLELLGCLLRWGAVSSVGVKGCVWIWGSAVV